MTCTKEGVSTLSAQIKDDELHRVGASEKRADTSAPSGRKAHSSYFYLVHLYSQSRSLVGVARQERASEGARVARSIRASRRPPRHIHGRVVSVALPLALHGNRALYNAARRHLRQIEAVKTSRRKTQSTVTLSLRWQ